MKRLPAKKMSSKGGGDSPELTLLPPLFPPWFDQEIGSNSSIPAYPMLFENGGTTDLSTTANTIGIMRNGVSMYRFVVCMCVGCGRVGAGFSRLKSRYTHSSLSLPSAAELAFLQHSTRTSGDSERAMFGKQHRQDTEKRARQNPMFRPHTLSNR